MIFVYYNDDTFGDIARSVHYAIEKVLLNSNSNSTNNQPHQQVMLVTRIDPKQAVNSDNLYIMLGLNNETPFLPPRFIAYQFEQTGNANSWFTESYITKLKSAIEIWDYSIVNIQNLKKNHPDLPLIRYVPLGYTPTLRKITQKPSQEKHYDILFYGSANPRRDTIIRNLRHAGFRVYYGEYSCWDEDRGRLIAESKIVLNLHYYPNPVLETSRITYLVANSAFVISEPSLDPILDKEYRNYAVFSETENLIETCRYYIDNPEARDNFVKQAHAKFTAKEFTVPTNLLSPPTPSQPLETSTQPSQTPAPNQSNKLTKDHLAPPQTEVKGKIRPKFNVAEVEITSEGDAVLKLDAKNVLDPASYPKVSLVTPTANRGWSLMSLAMRNFYRFDYPRDKLEWVIVDSQDSGKPLVMPQDSRIRYHLVDSSIPLWKKRNMCNELATGEIIVHLDDDDMYFSSSILAKVKLLDKYRRQKDQNNIECIGCTQLGIYHLIDNYSYLADTKYISEASMAYTRKFWESKAFTGDNLEMGEGYSFIEGRENQVATIPYYFNLIALTHNQNYTGKLRTHRDTSGKKHDNFFNLWDKETQYFFLELKLKAINAYKAINNKK